jgi:hypothetical protein
MGEARYQVIRLFAAEGDPADAPAVLGQILQWGPAGVIIILILTGVLVTKAQLESMKNDRDEWKAAYQQESQAHESTREALREAVAAAATSLEVSRTTTALLNNLGHMAQTQKPGAS